MIDCTQSKWPPHSKEMSEKEKERETDAFFPLSSCNYERILFAVIKNDKFRTQQQSRTPRCRQRQPAKRCERERDTECGVTTK